MATLIRLRELLEERGMTQTELHTRTGLAYSTINDLYHNKTRRIELATLDLLCEALECGVGDILHHVPEGRRSRTEGRARRRP